MNSSIRSKITTLTIYAVVITMVIVTVIAVTSVKKIGDESAEKILTLMSETGQKNLDSYFESVEKSVEFVSAYAEADLMNLSDDDLTSHVERVESVFNKVASRTEGALTYYYRIDPEITDKVDGFWYVDSGGEEGFERHEVTDISGYDTSDTSNIVWFTVPKNTGEPIWLPPYVTENLDVRVISYNVPIYWDETFVGVIGIEINYQTMATQVDNIKLYDNGYAFINDSEGNLIYHPYIDITTMSDDEKPKTPDGLVSESTIVKYSFDGVSKMAEWKELENGMRLNVSVPLSEINKGWEMLVAEILVVAVLLVLIFILIAFRFTKAITLPLRELTAAAEQVNEGNYDVDLGYRGDDEVGLLTKTFNQLVSYLRDHITDLSQVAYKDELTSVRNKAAYNKYMAELKAEIENTETAPFDLAFGMFDCDGLKTINAVYGHNKGDEYLKTGCRVVCKVFRNSAVFRLDNDEFLAVIRDDDFENMEELAVRFEKKQEKINKSAENEWEEAHVSMGIAVYDPKMDRSLEDVIARATRIMNDSKKKNKSNKE